MGGGDKVLGCRRTPRLTTSLRWLPTSSTMQVLVLLVSVVLLSLVVVVVVEVVALLLLSVPNIVQQTMDEVAMITGRSYKLFDYYGDRCICMYVYIYIYITINTVLYIHIYIYREREILYVLLCIYIYIYMYIHTGDSEADRVIVMMGSAAKTAEETVDWMRQQGDKADIHTYDHMSIYIYIYIHTHILMYLCIHLFRYIYIYIYVFRWVSSRSASSGRSPWSTSSPRCRRV